MLKEGSHSRRRPRPPEAGLGYRASPPLVVGFIKRPATAALGRGEDLDDAARRDPVRDADVEHRAVRERDAEDGAALGVLGDVDHELAVRRAAGGWGRTWWGHSSAKGEGRWRRR